MKLHLAVTFWLALCSSAICLCQDNLRTQLFSEADRLMAQAKEKKADMYAPRSYGKALDYYREADGAYQRGGKLEDMRERLKNAEAYFAKALDQCKLGETAFSGVMAARGDAMTAGAPASYPQLWDKAEARFLAAARDLEDGNTGSAQKGGSEAEAGYRAAELEAIKTNFLGPARKLIDQAKEADVRRNAPVTLARAQALTAEAEDLLKRNRYDTDSARQLSQEAKYQAAHAIYLNGKIASMKQKDKSFEDAILESEDQFGRVAGALGVQARFDSGYDGPVNAVLAAVREKDARLVQSQNKLTEAADAIRGRENEIENLKQQVASMESRLGSLSEAERKLQETGRELEHTLDVQRAQEGTVRQVSAMFSDEEGNVLRDEDNIIIRLYGLTFGVGKSTIEPELYPLLTKVQDAIKKFPNCHVSVEGHTDSQGSDEANQALSDKRAKSVAEYLMANMNAELDVKYQGFGETRPIASNDTPEGRAKNRRIDIVITPRWASK